MIASNWIALLTIVSRRTRDGAARPFSKDQATPFQRVLRVLRTKPDATGRSCSGAQRRAVLLHWGCHATLAGIKTP